MLAPDYNPQIFAGSTPRSLRATAFSDYRSRDRFSSLDGLRCLCIIAVLWHHGPVWSEMVGAPILLTRGFLGVDFFFVLSGFLITTLLLRETERQGHFSLRSFYHRRILRILPVYFFLVTAVSIYFVLLKGQQGYAALVPYYYLFLANFLDIDIPLLSPTWSLSVEEQYYLIWPLLLILLPQRALLPVLGLLIALNVAGIMGFFAVLGIHAFDVGPLHIALPNATYAPILMGSALAVLLRSLGSFSALFLLFGHRSAPPLLMVLVLGLATLLPSDLRGLPNLAVHFAMTACLASLVLREDHLLARVLQWKPLARVGVISYGIYLYHLIVLTIVNALFRHLAINTPWLTLLLYIAVSILMADISYRTLEAWFRRFKRH